MLFIEFEGWFQCRLATDPDPTDEPRGASGFTFALAGEPDLDRAIRFHHPVAPRSHGPKVGVFVRAVLLDGHPVPEHPLLGAPVHLLGEPKFESRNYVLRDSAQGAIVPFRLQLQGRGLTLEREDYLFPEDPTRKLHEIPAAYHARRGSIVPLTVDLLRIADATGIRDPLLFRRQRKQLLEADLRTTREPVAKAALEKRIAELSLSAPSNLQVAALTVYTDYRFDIRGPVRLQDPEHRLGYEPDPQRGWPIAFWMGAWDSDALCGFVRGTLSIPRVGEVP